MKQLSYILIVSTFIAYGCQTVVDVDVPPIRANIALNGLITKDSLFQVGVYKTLAILDRKDVSELQNASVILYENDVKVDSLIYYDDLKAYRNLNVRGVVGKNYSLKVSAAGYIDASATNTIPELPEIVSATYQDSAGIDRDGEYFRAFDILINDNNPGENYYAIEIVTSYSYIRENFSAPDDTVVVTSRINGVDDLLPPLEKGHGSIVFNDHLFNGKAYTVTLKAYQSSYYSPIQDSNYKVVLKSITKEYYEYFRRLDDHIETRDFQVFVGEPVLMPSNVTGGYGIFAGYSEITRDVVKKN